MVTPCATDEMARPRRLVMCVTDCSRVHRVAGSSSLKHVLTVELNGGPYRGCSLSANGERFVALADGHSLCLWSRTPSARSLQRSIRTAASHTRRTALTCDKAEALVCFGLIGCAGTGSPTRGVLSSDCTHVTCSAFSADGDHIACGLSDGSLRVWDANSLLELSRLAGHAAAVACVGFGAVNHIVVSLSCDCTLISWDCQQRLRLHTYQFTCSHTPTAFALLFRCRILAIGTAPSTHPKIQCIPVPHLCLRSVHRLLEKRNTPCDSCATKNEGCYVRPRLGIAHVAVPR